MFIPDDANFITSIVNQTAQNGFGRLHLNLPTSIQSENKSYLIHHVNVFVVGLA